MLLGYFWVSCHLNLAPSIFLFGHVPLFDPAKAYAMLSYWANCIAALILSSKCMLALLFFDFTHLPLFFKFLSSVCPRF
jgi:hypothetical protein